MKKRDGDGFFRDSDELNHAIFLGRTTFRSQAYWNSSTTSGAPLLPTAGCRRWTVNGNRITQIRQPTASTGYCDYKILLRRGILRPTDLSLLSALSSWHTSDARNALDLLAPLPLLSTITAVLQFQSATDKTPGHPYSKSSSSSALGLRFFFLVVPPPEELPAAASCSSRLRVQHWSMV